MKPIIEYLLSKSKPKTCSRFIDDPTKDELIDFFESNGFERVNPDGWTAFCRLYDNANGPVYWLGHFNTDDGDSQWVRFGNGKDEPMFFWRIKKPANGSWDPMWSMMNPSTKEFATFDEFKKYVCDYFGWT